MAKNVYIMYLKDGRKKTVEAHNLFEASSLAGVKTDEIERTCYPDDPDLVWSSSAKIWMEYNEDLNRDAQLIAFTFARAFNEAKPEVAQYFGVAESAIARAFADLNRVYSVSAAVSFIDNMTKLGIECTKQESENIGPFYVLRPVITASDVELLIVTADDVSKMRENHPEA